MQYMGQTGVDTTTYVSAREDDCLVCAFTTAKIEIAKTATLAEFLEKVKTEQKLQRPSLNSDQGTLWQAGPEALEKVHAAKLTKTFE